MTIDRRNYSGPDVLDPKVEKTLPITYLNRLQQMPSAAYLLNPSKPGKLHCAKRGKLMVMAAGKVGSDALRIQTQTQNYNIQHAVTFHFGLEAHIIGMSCSRGHDKGSALEGQRGLVMVMVSGRNWGWRKSYELR